MPAKWQLWMPLKIDAFKSSPAVRAMHPAARLGFLYLLTFAWQTEDCTLPSDPLELAEISELGDELWAVHGARILRKFDFCDNGRLRNSVCYVEWQEARRKFSQNHESPEELSRKRSEAGQKGNRVRWNGRKSVANCDDPIAKPSLTGTETVIHIPPSAPETHYEPDADFLDSVPDGLTAVEYVRELLGALVIVAGHGLKDKFERVLDALAKSEKCKLCEATTRLGLRMRAALREDPELVWDFWLTDSRWKGIARASPATLGMNFTPPDERPLAEQMGPEWCAKVLRRHTENKTLTGLEAEYVRSLKLASK